MDEKKVLDLSQINRDMMHRELGKLINKHQALYIPEFKDGDNLEEYSSSHAIISCNDLINLVSLMPVRDKRLINKFNRSTEVQTADLKLSVGVRKCRAFTVDGIKRYLNEGRIKSYENVCAFFGVTPKDMLAEELENKKLPGNKFNTDWILRWLFGKRKKAQILGKTALATDIAAWLKLSSNKKNGIIEKNYDTFMSLYDPRYVSPKDIAKPSTSSDSSDELELELE